MSTKSLPTVACEHCNGTGKEIDQKALGVEMRAWRIKCGLTLRAVAKQMNLSAAYLSDLEKGRRRWRKELIGPYREAVK